MLWLPRKCPLSKCVDGSRHCLQIIPLSLAVVCERGANCWNDGNYIDVIMPKMCTWVCCDRYMCLQRLGMYSVARSLKKLGGKNFSAVLMFQTWGPSGFRHFVSLPQSNKVNRTNSLSALSCRGLGQLLCGWLYEAVARMTYGVEGWYTEERDV
jgi:hypothetical protein